eukprot:6538213-Pyramimonas_sp.AAC.1
MWRPSLQNIQAYVRAGCSEAGCSAQSRSEQWQGICPQHVYPALAQVSHATCIQYPGKSASTALPGQSSCE